ncbi:RNA-binding protein Nova-1 [Sparganum proliferum]
MCAFAKRAPFRYLRRLSTATNPPLEKPDVRSLFLDEYAQGLNSGKLASNESLARFLATRIVAFGRNFIVLDKPASLSVWGHARSKATVHGRPTLSSTNETPLSLRDCLPQLRTLLCEEYGLWPGGPTGPSSPRATPPALACSILFDKKDPLEKWPPPQELFIVESLPSAYSGLILLATSPEYADFAKKFYANSNRDRSPASFYQTLLAVCWGCPSRRHSDMEAFPLSVYKVSDSISVAFRPTDNKLTGVARRRGSMTVKGIGHAELARSASGDASLVAITCNTVYAGLPELFLLHEGCEVIGETLQSSRLTRAGTTPIVLPPTSASFNNSLPPKLSRALGDGKLQRSDLPVHIHRAELSLPCPLRSSTDHGFSRRVSRPFGRIQTSVLVPDHGLAGDASHLLSWRPVPRPGHSPFFFPLARSLDLPSHFKYTLNCLRINFNLLDFHSRTNIKNTDKCPDSGNKSP